MNQVGFQTHLFWRSEPFAMRDAQCRAASIMHGGGMVWERVSRQERTARHRRRPRFDRLAQSNFDAERRNFAKNVVTSSLWAFEGSIEKGRGCHATRLGSWRRGVNYAGFDLTHSFHGFCFVVAFGRRTWFKGRAAPATHARNLRETEASGDKER